jgi:hypothetical protein
VCVCVCVCYYGYVLGGGRWVQGGGEEAWTVCVLVRCLIDIASAPPSSIRVSNRIFKKSYFSIPCYLFYRTVQGCNVLYWGELGTSLTAGGVRGADLLDTYG